MKKFLVSTAPVGIIFSTLLFIFPLPAYADAIIPFTPQSSTNLLRILSFNYIVNIIALYLVCYVYLRYKDSVKILIASVVVTIMGGMIDVVSSIAALLITSPFGLLSKYSIVLGIIFVTTFFLICFILLGLMYKLIINHLFTIENSKKSLIAAGILAFVTHPLLYISLLLLLDSINSKLYQSIFAFFYEK